MPEAKVTERFADPFERLALPSVLFPSTNETDPVGVPLLEDTVAVRVADWPGEILDGACSVVVVSVPTVTLAVAVEMASEGAFESGA